jgi:mannose-6-phosphate isomerase-like protein (cupin superfamily)
MKTAQASILALLVSSSLLAAGSTTTPATETYLSAGELASKVGNTMSGVGFPVHSSPGYQVLMIRRDHAGEPEVHMQMNDTIIVESGRGRFLIGGEVKGNREIRPTEWRGGEMSGARQYEVSVGDLLLIPAGIPHQAIVTTGTFTYLTIKTPREAAPNP